MTSLNVRALRGLLFTLLVMGAIVFLAAGTLRWGGAWVFLALFGALGLGLTLYLIECDPELLARRMRGGPTAEKEPRQKIIMWLISGGFGAILIVCGLDRRFGWSNAPDLVAIAGDVLFALGWAIIFLVFRENSFSSATIEIAADQRVISSGPYALGAPPDVRRRAFLSYRHPACARLMVGIMRRPPDRARADLADFRGGEISRGETAGLCGVSGQGEISARAVHLVAPFGLTWPPDTAAGKTPRHRAAT